MHHAPHTVSTDTLVGAHKRSDIRENNEPAHSGIGTTDNGRRGERGIAENMLCSEAQVEGERGIKESVLYSEAQVEGERGIEESALCSKAHTCAALVAPATQVAES